MYTFFSCCFLSSSNNSKCSMSLCLKYFTLLREATIPLWIGKHTPWSLEEIVVFKTLLRLCGWLTRIWCQFGWNRLGWYWLLWHSQMNTILPPHNSRILQTSFLNLNEYLHNNGEHVNVIAAHWSNLLTNGTVETSRTTSTNTIFPYTLHSSILILGVW